jgi:23S rRNA (guanine745-N1)-methyltransferase
MYRCPLCHQKLSPQTSAWRCPQGHQFDIAREGYVNLLPVQQKKSLDPGDNAEMIQARRAFLDAGHYQFLSEAINQQLAGIMQSTDTLLDLGCGEGYYSAKAAAALTGVQVYGVDISKTAVRYASKRYQHLHCCVASSYALPFNDGAFAAILRIYAPSDAGEMARVLRPGGYLLTVSPAPEHLLQFKQQAYAEVRLHPDTVKNEAGFRHLQRQRLQALWQAPDAATMLQLIEMTPLAYKLNHQMRETLCQQLPAIQLDFYLDLYQKDEGLLR